MVIISHYVFIFVNVFQKPSPANGSALPASFSLFLLGLPMLLMLLFGVWWTFIFIAGRGCCIPAVLKFPFKAPIVEFDPIIHWPVLMPLVKGLISLLPIVMDGGFIIGPMPPPIGLPILIIELPIPRFAKEPFIVAEPI